MTKKGSLFIDRANEKSQLRRIVMEQGSNSKNQNHLITWGKAYLYALGWLVCWSIIVIPITWHTFFISDGPNLIVLIVGLFIFLTLVMNVLKRVHHSWRVPIAFCVEAVIVSGLTFLVILMLLLGAAAHPV